MPFSISHSKPFSQKESKGEDQWLPVFLPWQAFIHPFTSRLSYSADTVSHIETFLPGEDDKEEENQEDQEYEKDDEGEEDEDI